MNLIGSYNYALVALSVLISMFASYAALALAGRVAAAGGWTRTVWLLGGAGAMGTGIWSMHYIGMLAFILPVPVAYHWPTVLVSLIAAILASVIALHLVSRQKMGAFRVLAGSVLMGAGISGMHYIGMAAMRLPAMCQFDPFLVVLSVVFAFLISLAAIWITFYFRVEKARIDWRKIAGAIVMGAAIPVMHYTGMAAASFTPSSMPVDLSDAVSISTLGAAGIAAAALIVLGLALVTSWADRRFAIRTIELQGEKLHQSEAYLSEAQRISRTGSFGWRIPAGELRWSEETFRIFQYDRASKPTLELIFQRVHPEDAVLVKRTLERALRDGEGFDYEHRLLMPDGSVKYVHVVAHALSNESGNVDFVGALMDFTEQRQARAALEGAFDEIKKSQDVLREQARLLDLTHDTVFVRDLNDVITYWNRGAEELYGWRREEAVGKISHQLTQTVFPVPLKEISAELLRTGRWEGELIHTKRDGTQVVVVSRWSLQRDEQGLPAAILETNNDITERKRAEAELHESLRRYRHIFQTVGVSIWEEDFSQVKKTIDELKATGVSDFSEYLAAHPELVQQAISIVKVIDVNDASVKLFGAQSKDELLVSLDNVFLPETQEVFARELIAIAEGRANFESETVMQTLAGDKLVVLVTITFPPPPAMLESVQVTITDITERRRAEEALRHAQAELAHITRVTTLGEMTASIAHEINQPLAAVITNGGACLRWLLGESPNLDEAREAARRVIRDGNRASDVIARIRALMRKTDTQKARFDINDAIQEIVLLTQHEAARKNVTLRLELTEGLPPVFGDKVQLQQVALNLLMNGVEAMASVSQRPRELLIQSHSHESHHVLITVRDSGMGIAPEDLEKIFDAFYTTKSQGMGMGLAISRSIIENHGGRLWAAPNEGPGVTFHFTLLKYDSRTQYH